MGYTVEQAQDYLGNENWCRCVVTERKSREGGFPSNPCRCYRNRGFNRIDNNYLSWVLCIATASKKTPSLNSATILTHKMTKQMARWRHESTCLSLPFFSRWILWTSNIYWKEPTSERGGGVFPENFGRDVRPLPYLFSLPYWWPDSSCCWLYLVYVARVKRGRGRQSADGRRREKKGVVKK